MVSPRHPARVHASRRIWALARRSEGHLIGGMIKVDKELPNPLSIE